MNAHMIPVLLVLSALRQVPDEVRDALSAGDAIRALSHQEGLIRSVHARFEVRTFPTSETERRKAEQYWRSKGGDFKRLGDFYLRPPANTESIDNTNDSTFWSTPLKMKLELRTPGSPSESTPSYVFTLDGLLERVLGRQKETEKPRGQIWPLETHGWKYRNELTPFTFLYWYCGTSFGELLAKDPNVKSEIISREGQTVLEIKVKHFDPVLKTHTFCLVFDDAHRLVERRIIAAAVLNGEVIEQAYVKERHCLSEYRPHKLPSGETIWYPHKGLYKYYGSSQKFCNLT